MTFKRVFLGLTGALAIVALSACSSMPSVRDAGDSPRKTTVAAAETTIRVMDDLTAAIQLGVVSDNLADDIVQYMPEVANVAAVYLENTEACVVIDGALQTDPATGRECQKSQFKRAFRDLSATLQAASLRAGVDTDAGRAIGLASIVLRRQLQPSSGGVWDGYQKEPDIPLEQYQEVVADLSAARDRLVQAAQAFLAAAREPPGVTEVE